MSENRITDPDVLLQQELDAMAREVPDMPASFRKGWREAVRQDAMNRAEPAPESARNQTETPAPRRARASLESARNQAEASAPHTNETERPASGRLLRSRRWVGWACAAAAMVFLIGGTMLTRSTLSPRLRVSPAVTSAAGKDTGKAPKSDLAEEALEAAEALPEGDALIPVSSGDSRPAAFSGTNFLEDAPVEDTWQADEHLQLLAAPNQAASTTLGVMEGSFEAEEADADAGVAPVSSSRDTEKREAPDLGTRIRDFLEDMGAFILAALPYLAGAAVLAAVILLIKRKGRS